MSDIETAVRTHVREVLEHQLRIEGLQETPSGFAFRLMSSQVGVLVHEFSPGQVFVRLQGWVAGDVPLTPQLFEHVAIHGGDWLYGHVTVIPGDTGTGTVVLRHEFAAQHLTDDLLKEGLGRLAGTLEQLDDQITGQFGGHKYYEDF